MLKIIRNMLRRGWLVKLPSPENSYAFLLDAMQRNEHFSFSRWGDGEWEAVLGEKNDDEVNCDGHQYFSSMTEALREVLISNPSYLMGMQKLAYHKLLGKKIDRYLRANDIRRKWLNADAFHNASAKGEINTFFSVLSSKSVLVVGPAHLRHLNLFSFDLCEVPVKNCWLDREKVMKDIRSALVRKDTEVILFCAGMTSNWLVHQLNNDFVGFILDVGSLLDPYAGVSSRNYHKRLSAEALGRPSQQ